MGCRIIPLLSYAKHGCATGENPGANRARVTGERAISQEGVSTSRRRRSRGCQRTVCARARRVQSIAPGKRKFRHVKVRPLGGTAVIERTCGFMTDSAFLALYIAYPDKMSAAANA